MVDSLILDFCGEEYEVREDSELSFGRRGDIEVDDNPYLHRRLGLVRHTEGAWWLENVGTSITMEVADRNSPSRMQVAPGSSVSLPFASCVLRFRAGQSTYEIEAEVPVSAPQPIGQTSTEPPTSTVTVTAQRLGINLTDDQKRCIVALARKRLEEPSAPATIPTNKQAAASLGWKITRFNRKLDNVCDRLADAGVGGLRGDSASLATNRRQRLVDYAIGSNLITAEDLDLLIVPVNES